MKFVDYRQNSFENSSELHGLVGKTIELEYAYGKTFDLFICLFYKTITHYIGARVDAEYDAFK